MTNFNIWLHRYALLVALCTLVLIFVGGLVTSTESGLAVPDWPLANGQLFPPMEGGVLFEHGHRLVAASVGFLTIILAIWLWRAETRKWVKLLGVVALLTVIFQGLLGGITVLYKLPTPVSVSHAALAQIFLCLTVTLAVVTSKAWQETCRLLVSPTSPSLKSLATVTTCLIFIQTIIGALMRHTKSGLAIPDFPLSFGRLIPPEFTSQILVNFAHRIWALVVAAFIIWVVLKMFREYGSEERLVQPGIALLITVVIQISLGAFTVWSERGVGITTLHVAGGATTLAISLMLTLRIHRLFSSSESRITETVAHANAGTE